MDFLIVKKTIDEIEFPSISEAAKYLAKKENLTIDGARTLLFKGKTKPPPLIYPTFLDGKKFKSMIDAANYLADRDNLAFNTAYHIIRKRMNRA